VSHSRTLRAFASRGGVNPENPSRYLGSFYSHNTSMTPFKLEGVAGGNQSFEHNREENYDQM